MDLTPFVTRLRDDLAGAAAAGGAEAQGAAERLALALDPATRMVLLEALSQAAAEITGHLDRDVVDVRLAGREPEFVVTHLDPPAAPEPPAPPAPPAAPEAEDAGSSRTTLRLPESLKQRAEEAATAAGQSLNTWLVDAVRDALDGGRVELQVGSSRLTVGGRGPSTGPAGPTDSPAALRRKQLRGWVG